MKRLFLSIIILAASALALKAAVWTVSNVATRPAQFTNLTSAFNAAADGDTILITGGGSTYTSASTVKSLVIIGENMSSPFTQVESLTLGRFNTSLSASGSKIYGLSVRSLNLNGTFTGAAAGQRTINNVIVERCRIDDLNFSSSGDSYSNNTFRNCYFVSAGYGGTTNFYSATYTGNLFTNCTYSNYRFSGGTSLNLNAGVIVRNSVFMNRTSATFSNITGMIIENNIFYAAEPTGATGCTFNNNLTYLCNNNTIPYGDNLGSGNIINQDPKFINFPQLGGAFSYAYNFGLQTGSPAIATGTNGTNIGLTGGNAPLNNLIPYPKIPNVTELNIPVSSVPVGGTLQINIKANSRD